MRAPQRRLWMWHALEEIEVKYARARAHTHTHRQASLENS